jgi:hypothetical protein
MSALWPLVLHSMWFSLQTRPRGVRQLDYGLFCLNRSTSKYGGV